LGKLGLWYIPKCMRELFYSPVDSKHLKQERNKARELRKTQWWKTQLQRGVCHYCEKKFSPQELTMDHIVALGRGGTSNRGNVVVSCKTCNSTKAHKTPAEIFLETL
jgi:5-methylcytosine-specific restriction enzyme A